MQDINYYEEMLKAKDELIEAQRGHIEAQRGHIEAQRGHIEILKELCKDYKTAYQEPLTATQLKEEWAKLDEEKPLQTGKEHLVYVCDFISRFNTPMFSKHIVGLKPYTVIDSYGNEVLFKHDPDADPKYGEYVYREANNA